MNAKYRLGATGDFVSHGLRIDVATGRIDVGPDLFRPTLKVRRIGRLGGHRSRDDFGSRVDA